MTKAKRRHIGPPKYSVMNCNFTGTPPNEQSIGAAVAIAKAAEANARALEKAADMLKGPDALLKIGAWPPPPPRGPQRRHRAQPTVKPKQNGEGEHEH